MGEIPYLCLIIITIHCQKFISKLVALVVGESDDTKGFSRDFGELVIVLVIPSFVQKIKPQVGYIGCNTS